jgi:predicted NACHT family NTPase
MLKEYLIKEALDVAFKRARQYLAEAKSSLETDPNAVEAALNLHLNGVRRWSEEVYFADLKAAKHTTNVYVHLNAFVYPRRIRIEPTERIRSISLDQALENSSEHIVLLGQPGAGKSTSMKHVSHRLLTDETFLVGGPAFPFILRMQELNTTSARPRTATDEILSDRVIFAALASQFGLSFRFAKKPSSKDEVHEAAALAEGVVMTFLEELRPLLIIEGFDELASHEKREIAVREIRALTRQLSKARVIVTSRTGEFPYQIENSSHFEIRPLTRQQIGEFAEKWLESKKRAARFMQEIDHSPFADTAIKPLTLAHLCAIYERIGRIPEKPKTVYRKVVNLLLEEWDEQRSVKRVSRYAEFSPDRKFEFLAHLAYELTLAIYCSP